MTKEQIRASFTVTDVLERYGVKVQKGRCKGFCHNGKDLNMAVSKDFAYCFVCDKRFDVFAIVEWFENCDFNKAFEMLGGEKPWTINAARRAHKRKLNETKLEEAQRRYNRAFALWHSADFIITYYSRMKDEKYKRLYEYAIQNISRFENELEESEVRLNELRKLC